MREITLPETKPALEWVNGRALQKVSPKRRHAIAQARFVAALDAWAQQRGSGVVGTEWHFQIRPPGQERRPLVPDIAFLSYRSLSFKKQQVTEVPRVAPDAVVEIRSPGDLLADIEEKVRVYLAAGTRVVFLVDPKKCIVIVRDADGKRVIAKNGVLSHSALPGFQMPVSSLFSLPRPQTSGRRN